MAIDIALCSCDAAVTKAFLERIKHLAVHRRKKPVWIKVLYYILHLLA
jgi:hypothetical protein